MVTHAERIVVSFQVEKADLVICKGIHPLPTNSRKDIGRKPNIREVPMKACENTRRDSNPR